MSNMPVERFNRLGGLELSNGQYIEVEAHFDMEYEEDGVVLFCIDVSTQTDGWDHDNNGPEFKTVETNVYIYPDGRTEVRERGL